MSEPKYGERRPEAEPVLRRDAEPELKQPGEHRALGYTVMLVLIGVPLLTVCIPLCAWLTRLALGG